MRQAEHEQPSDPTAVLLAKVYALILSWPMPDEVDELAADEPNEKDGQRPVVAKTAVAKKGQQDDQ